MHAYSLYIHLQIFTSVEISTFLNGKKCKLCININLTTFCIFVTVLSNIDNRPSTHAHLCTNSADLSLYHEGANLNN